MGWHYQVMRHHAFDHSEDYYEIHEYYPDTGSGHGWTADQATANGETVEEVIKCLEMMLNDVKKYGVRDYESGELVE